MWNVKVTGNSVRKGQRTASQWTKGIEIRMYPERSSRWVTIKPLRKLNWLNPTDNWEKLGQVPVTVRNHQEQTENNSDVEIIWTQLANISNRSKTIELMDWNRQIAQRQTEVTLQCWTTAKGQSLTHRYILSVRINRCRPIYLPCAEPWYAQGH